ncbi:MAG: InlB B-repeat-containing protein [Bifidobacterium crudilactis]|jgi:uncharacterized repeat protein (TIGR02543 family)|nr:InlB B-repeat-containing protein [Bifidobacterium crudilactis]MCI1889413.1 InlB B-repeat-containing protein [Bifidobacterium crudilactis]
MAKQGHRRAASPGITTPTAISAALLTMSLLLAAALATVLPERAAADDPVDLGPDGYFSTLAEGALPIVEADNETPDVKEDGWVNTRRIMFGKQGSSGTYGGSAVSGGYKTLAKGAVASANVTPFSGKYETNFTASNTTSLSTSVAADEALLWAEDVVNGVFHFGAKATCYSGDFTLCTNDFDSGAAVTGYKSTLARRADAIGLANYSTFEQGLLRAAPLEGVCASSSGCGSGSYTQQSNTRNAYTVFPLSIGDMNKYFNHTSGRSSDNNLRCKANLDSNNTGRCANTISSAASWLRSPYWGRTYYTFMLWSDGYTGVTMSSDDMGLRPALRLKLERLLLTANISDQNQSESGDLQLTFVDPGKTLDSWEASVEGEADSRTLALSGSSAFGTQLGWKIVDPDSGTVLGSGRTGTGGNLALPESAMTDDTKDYELYVWGQENGSASTGWSNKATAPVKTTVRLRNTTTATLEYSANGGSGDVPASVSKDADSSVTLASGSTLAKEGFTFAGWNTKADGSGDSHAAGSSYTLSADITLYAEWRAALSSKPTPTPLPTTQYPGSPQAVANAPRIVTDADSSTASRSNKLATRKHLASTGVGILTISTVLMAFICGGFSLRKLSHRD